jgi:hypothetical protein
MEYILYGMIVFCFAMPIAIVVGVVVTAFMDWRHKRKYGAWEELKRTNYERRRPAAK